MNNNEYFKQAKYGMMIHFGLYSILAGEYKGQRMGTTIGEWIQSYFRIPNKEYEKLAGVFNPIYFDADEWVDIAIKAVSSKGDGKKIINQINGQKIISIVADYYNLTPSQITGKERNAQLVLARHLSMYLIRKYIDIPLKKIGEMFGGKDHTTVMSAITKVDKELKTDAQLQSAVEDLEKKIKE